MLEERYKFCDKCLQACLVLGKDGIYEDDVVLMRQVDKTFMVVRKKDGEPVFLIEEGKARIASPSYVFLEDHIGQLLERI